MIYLFLSNGEKISTTKEHKFYIQNKYIIAEDIKLDTKLFTVNNVEIKLLEKREIFYEKEILVYNFEVEGNHNYFVGENRILVHKELENSPKQSRDTETHLKNGGEIVIDDEGMWKMGLPSTNKLTGKYERLNGGYYVVEFPEGLGSFKNHSIARFDCDRSLLTGENEKDFTVFWEGVSDKNSINFKNSEATKNYVRKQEELTLHHEGDGFEVVDRTLHQYFRHTGEAAVLRTETKIGRRITMKEFWEHQKNIKKLF